MRYRAVFLFTFLAVALGTLAAQSNDRIDELLGQAPARWDSAAYLVLTSVAAIPESATLAEAFQAAVAKGLAAPDRKAGDPVTVQDLSFLLMKARKVPGGWEWSLMPSARAAYRELAYHELINSSGGPDRTVAGDEVVRTLGAVVDFTGGAR